MAELPKDDAFGVLGLSFFIIMSVIICNQSLTEPNIRE